MLEAYSNDLNITSGSNVAFNKVPIQTLTTKLSSDGTTVNLTTAGIFKVTFGASISTGTITTSTGMFTLVVSGEDSTKAIAEQTFESTSDYNLGFTTLVKVVIAPLGNVATLSVNYTGPAITADLVDIVITKVA